MNNDRLDRDLMNLGFLNFLIGVLFIELCGVSIGIGLIIIFFLFF